VNKQINLNNILDIKPFEIFFIEILMVNKDEFQKKKDFYIFGIMANTLWNLQTCCKI